MGLKIVPAPGTPAADSEHLAERERALTAKEAELLTSGAQLEALARERHGRLCQVREALQRLAQSASAKEAEAAFARAMALAVPAHSVSPATLQSLEQRRKAIAMRELALHAESAAIEERRKKLPALDSALDGLFAEAAALGRRAEEGATATAVAEALQEPRASAREADRPRGTAPGDRAQARSSAAGANAPSAVMNRRATRRVELQVEVTLQSESNFFTGFSGDISEAGVFVATYQELLPPGTPVVLTLTLPGAAPMSLSGQVRWVRDTGGPRGGLPGMGIAFLNVGAKEAAAIQLFISGREPLFWTE